MQWPPSHIAGAYVYDGFAPCHTPCLVVGIASLFNARCSKSIIRPEKPRPVRGKKGYHYDSWL